MDDENRTDQVTPWPMVGEPVTEASAVADLAIAATEPSELDPAIPQAVIVPRGSRLEIPDLSDWRERPERRKGKYRPATVESFLKYVDAHASTSESTVWVHPTSGSITAVLDDNGPELSGYRQWLAELKLEHTPEWDYWLGQDGKMLSQVDFALHVEQGLQQIEQPDAADVLEMAQSFHANTKVTFRSSNRLATGEQQLQYDEEVAASAGRTGQMTIPSHLVLLLAPFIGEAEVQIAARFRFRMDSGSLRLGYQLDQPGLVIRQALERIADRIGEAFPRTFVGDAPA